MQALWIGCGCSYLKKFSHELRDNGRPIRYLTGEGGVGVVGGGVVTLIAKNYASTTLTLKKKCRSQKKKAKQITVHSLQNKKTYPAQNI